MEITSPNPPENSPAALASNDDVAMRVVNKRYEGLVTVRNKAVKGKGAWYWAHLEPVLVRNPETNLPKAVKLRCNLCDAAFSASNPSRTASEHLKRGTCPNFSSASRPISSIPPSQLPPLASPSSVTATTASNRKRMNSSSSSSYQARGLSIEMGYSPGQIEQTHLGNIGLNQQQLVLSGGKEDLGALAMLEDSVKKLKSPKSLSPGPSLTKSQVDSALTLLADWFYESCGSVSLSSIESPKFKAFLNQVGIHGFSRREILGSRLDSKFDEVKLASDDRIRESVFLQVCSDGWKIKNCSNHGEENMVKFTANLPNGTSVFQKAVVMTGVVPSRYAEEVFWDSVTGICGNEVHRCVGIVADKYKGKALRNLEVQNQWMVNFSCQLQGFISLIKDFIKELPICKVVIDNCLKVASIFNNKHHVRNSFHKFQSDDVGFPALIRVPPPKCDHPNNFTIIVTMMEDILRCGRVLHSLVMDDSYKVTCADDPTAREVSEMVQDMRFWNELEAVHSLVKLIRDMAEEIEAERPLIGQCLPLWEDLKAKLKIWCTKFRVSESQVENILEKRFKKSYHPAFAAAFILDPQYLTRDVNGKYLPPFNCLTYEQVKDVDKLITRLVAREEGHIALMELMKWRSEGLDPLYAQAVQLKQRDPVTGKMKIANPQGSRLVWETCLKEFKSLGKVAVRLLFLQATSCRFNWSNPTRWVCLQGNSKVGLDRAQKMIFIAAQAKLERGDFTNDEDKDAELFSIAGGEDDSLNEVFTDASPV